jgi:hypothetical protein
MATCNWGLCNIYFVLARPFMPNMAPGFLPFICRFAVTHRKQKNKKGGTYIEAPPLLIINMDD